MPTFLLLIEPAPVHPARFLNRVAGMSASPFGPCPHTPRLHHAPHAYLAAISPEDPGATEDEVRDAVQDALAHPWEVSDTLEWQREVKRITGAVIGDPTLTRLTVLNVDLRGQPLGLDLPFPPAPVWSVLMAGHSRGAGSDLYPDEPGDLPEGQVARLVGAGESWPGESWPGTPPGEDTQELRDLTDDELATFSPRIGDDHGWPEDPEWPF